MERLACEFLLVRYVPDVVKGEFVNVGVVLREVNRAEGTVVRFTRNWSRVRSFDPQADVELMEAMEGELGVRIRATLKDPKPLLELLQESFSNSIQLTPARACMAESLPAEMDQLMDMYVQPVPRQRERKLGGRVAIASAMRREFEREGVWNLFRKQIAASQYTSAGDTLKIDCGYQSNGTVRMFQAVSLVADVEASKVLAYSTPGLIAGVQRSEAAGLEMTAVVESIRGFENSEEVVERYRFHVKLMEGSSIRVMTVADLPRMAEKARAELWN